VLGFLCHRGVKRNDGGRIGPSGLPDLHLCIHLSRWNLFAHLFQPTVYYRNLRNEGS
jgi:hypothetical protein